LRLGDWGEEFLAGQGSQLLQFNPEEEAALEAAFARHADWSTEFSTMSGKGKAPATEGPLDTADTWAKEFEPTAEDEANAQKVQDEIMSRFESLWNRDLEDDLGDDVADDWQTQFQRRMAGGPYTFETDNPYLDHPDPLAEAQRLRREGGSLTEAALAFEAALQGSEAMNAEVWRELGEVQAENEKESAAVRALERALELDENCLSAYVVSGRCL
jgi:peroxin-5